MDILAFIRSGIIENYCLGFCSEDEAAEVEKLSQEYPLVQSEIEKVRDCFEQQLREEAIAPSPSVKQAVLRAVYKQHASIDRSFAPLIQENTSAAELQDWVRFNKIESYKGDFENLYITELSSTDKVINFIVVAKRGHEQEVHEDFIEYLFVIEGACTMDFDGMKRSFSAGEIITILPGIKHTATVSLQQPMLALVQRQYHI